MKKTVLFVWGVIAILFVVSMLAPVEPLSVCGLTIRLPRLENMLHDSDSIPHVSVEDQLRTVEEQMVMSHADSLKMAHADSLRFYEDFFLHSIARIQFPDDDFEFLFPFFEAASNAKEKVVHVMHYGDSQIEGDRITGLIRDSLQGLFGGSGPGLLPLWQPISARSVAQSLSDSVPFFYAGGIMGRRASHDRYGAMAQVAELSGQAVSLSVSARNCSGFRNVTLFVGNTNSDTLRASLMGEQKCARSDVDALQTLKWRIPRSSEFSLDLQGHADVYGLEVDGGEGVAVSNIPMRGADGSYFSRMNTSLLRQMLSSLNTRLIIMEFGGNALPMLENQVQVDRYAKSFGKQVRLVRNVCPEAAIIVIGSADMSVKRDGVLQTHPMLPALAEAMKNAANENGAAFWDMYNVMGGSGSMIAWVQHQPAWASTDYVHFTTRGANRIATILWHSILMSYKYWLFVNQGTVSAS